MSQGLDTALPSPNGDGPLVRREPSADRQDVQEGEPMSEHERKGQLAPTEPPPALKGRPARSRWKERFRRAGAEAGISLIRGAATAAGGTLITAMVVWVQARA
jgi:hypothetical protein